MMAGADDSLGGTPKGCGRSDEREAAQLLPLLYRELHALARSKMRKLPPGQTLQPTALVHEAFVRLVQDGDPGWDGRGHFFAAAARAMRNILVDQARRKRSVKHGGQSNRLEAHLADLPIKLPAADVLALDEALTRLEQDDPRKAEIVHLRCFAGLTIEETAAVLNISIDTVKRDWRYLKTWLHAELTGEDEAAGG